MTETSWPDGHSPEKGPCGHPAAFLFKCPTRGPEERCVKCLLCHLLLTAHYGKTYKTCDPAGGSRPDYNELPDARDPENSTIFQVVEKIGQGTYLGTQLTRIIDDLADEVKHLHERRKEPK